MVLLSRHRLHGPRRGSQVSCTRAATCPCCRAASSTIAGRWCWRRTASIASWRRGRRRRFARSRTRPTSFAGSASRRSSAKAAWGRRRWQACEEQGCVYLHGIGGAAQIYARCVEGVTLSFSRKVRQSRSGVADCGSRTSPPSSPWTPMAGRCIRRSADTSKGRLEAGSGRRLSVTHVRSCQLRRWYGRVHRRILAVATSSRKALLVPFPIG